MRTTHWRWNFWALPIALRWNTKLVNLQVLCLDTMWDLKNYIPYAERLRASRLLLKAKHGSLWVRSYSWAFPMALEVTKSGGFLHVLCFGLTWLWKERVPLTDEEKAAFGLA